jgi:hypothetical protein
MTIIVWSLINFSPIGIIRSKFKITQMHISKDLAVFSNQSGKVSVAELKKFTIIKSLKH